MRDGPRRPGRSQRRAQRDSLDSPGDSDVNTPHAGRPVIPKDLDRRELEILDDERRHSRDGGADRARNRGGVNP